MTRTGRLARGIGLMPAAVFAVHQARYSLEYGSAAPRELLEQGHSYLSSATPWIVLVATVTAGALLARLAGASRGGRASRASTCRMAGVWATGTVALVSLYALQEFLEGLFATGHPAGLAGIFGHGGLWSIPAAMVVAGLLALALRGAHAVAALIAPRAQRVSYRPGKAIRERFPAPASWDVRLVAPLAACRAGRAPPAHLIAA